MEKALSRMTEGLLSFYAYTFQLNCREGKQILSFQASRATASKFRRIMSAIGTTLLHSPGWNEGKARNETLGIHERKVISSSVGAAL